MLATGTPMIQNGRCGRKEEWGMGSGHITLCVDIKAECRWRLPGGEAGEDVSLMSCDRTRGVALRFLTRLQLL